MNILYPVGNFLRFCLTLPCNQDKIYLQCVFVRILLIDRFRFDLLYILHIKMSASDFVYRDCE
ncbi:hypothetical protein CLOSTMETH_00717 [[Clostridium] methylpentosum DSM 5476]|uniref:Uncharacterized protein n=1 Tax=[Clostridium] methylpentosum DSM 5476 TaxID=537013 RepID=C0EA63_9FIRM|nr:hypothetical protein CLOSTMETH_00717 [[Clostridium] methylpentosum DSM 5476]